MKSMEIIAALLASISGSITGEIDLMFDIDGSGSIRLKSFEAAKNWVIDVVSGFDIVKDVQVGVVQYSKGKIETEIPLGKYHEKKSFNAAVRKITPHVDWDADIAQVIKKTLIEDMNGATSKFPNAARAMVVVTDGGSTDNLNLSSIHDLVEQANVTVFAVGIGSYNPDRLLSIAGKQDNVMALNDSTERNLVASKLRQAISDLDAEDPNTATTSSTLAIVIACSGASLFVVGIALIFMHVRRSRRKKENVRTEKSPLHGEQFSTENDGL